MIHQVSFSEPTCLTSSLGPSIFRYISCKNIPALNKSKKFHVVYYTSYRCLAYVLIINCCRLQGRQLENGLLALIEFLTQARHKLNHSKTPGVFGICSNINCCRLHFAGATARERSVGSDRIPDASQAQA